MTRPTRTQTLMATAYVWEQMSTCERAHVGAVAAIEGRIVATGYNGAPAGMPHCDHGCTCGKYSAVMHKGQHALDCPADSPCTVAVHAEANVIAFAAKYGVKLDGACLYTTMLPCRGCAQLIINAGIVAVVFDRDYRDHSGRALLTVAGVHVWQNENMA